MALETCFETIELSELNDLKTRMHDEGQRCVQLFATRTGEGVVDLTYSFQKGTMLSNYQIRGITKSDEIPSISDVYFNVFPYENEANELYGIHIMDLNIDFGGRFYDLRTPEPMTIISPEEKARREKQAKIAAAKAAKAAKDASGASTAAADAALEEKLKNMDPEKAAKVRAAMEAKAKKEAASSAPTADEMEEKLKNMDPEKAAKVRAAMEAKAKRDAAKNDEGEEN